MKHFLELASQRKRLSPRAATTDQEGLVRKIEDSIRVQWELIARHHGVPSPWLDWTKSPYVAAYFAFADKDLGDQVSIWILDREKFPFDVDEELWILDDDNVLRFNVKAIEQRSLFMRVEGGDQSVENLLGASLSRFDIPASERNLALDDLDEMLVNARSLFRDFHGAVSLAKYRVLQSWQ